MPGKRSTPHMSIAIVTYSVLTRMRLARGLAVHPTTRCRLDESDNTARILNIANVSKLA